MTTSNAKEKKMYKPNLYMCGGVVAPGAHDDAMAVLGLLVASWLLVRFGRRPTRNRR